MLRFRVRTAGRAQTACFKVSAVGAISADELAKRQRYPWYKWWAKSARVSEYNTATVGIQISRFISVLYAVSSRYHDFLGCSTAVCQGWTALHTGRRVSWLLWLSVAPTNGTRQSVGRPGVWRCAADSSNPRVDGTPGMAQRFSSWVLVQRPNRHLAGLV